MKPRLLEVYCGVGGATKGFQRAGWHVTGVDLAPQPRYCGDVFHQADALAFLADLDPTDFEAIHAGPPCQASCRMRSLWPDHEHVDLIAQTRDLLQMTGLPYVIENVPGAALVDPVQVCGSALGLGCGGAQLRRHRLFESNVTLLGTHCEHRSPTIGVYGHPGGSSRRDPQPRHSHAEWKLAMGIDWSRTVRELTEAIPPAYGEFLGHQLLGALR
jgi:DNA (cytosine-5)-methyltransferase 1